MTNIPHQLVTLGANPYPESTFDSILQNRNFEVYDLTATSLNHLILGRDDWSENALDGFIEARRGQTLYVYSQEMFLAYLASGIDPLSDRRVLDNFAAGHPALEFLSQWGFDWPATRIVPSGDFPEHVEPSDWTQVGILKHLGYTVGVNGLPPSRRRQILRLAYQESLPNVHDRAYMAQWGQPSTSKRLLKLANSIASFARTAKRKAAPPQQAIQDWQEDLEWLKNEFYQDRYRFHWPSTYVN